MSGLINVVTIYLARGAGVLVVVAGLYLLAKEVVKLVR